MTRKINLGRFGFDYESIDLTVEDAQSWEEAEKAIEEEHQKILSVFTPHMRQRLNELNKKAQLTFKEESERERLTKALADHPF